MSIVCLDVDYRGDQAYTGWVVFQDWSNARPLAEGTVVSVGAAAYQPGEFYRRELPPLLTTLRTFSTLPEGIVVDGFCWLGPERPGLGAHLYEALERRAWVVGVAKRPFQGNPGVPVERGNTRPLWVTACGLEPERAAQWVRAMHGPFRLPTLLKRADQLSRSI